MILKCNNCGHTTSIDRYQISIVGDSVVYKNKGVVISCGLCGRSDFTEKKIEGNFNVNFGKFNSMSSSEKKNLLKKRSHDHFKKYGREIKRTMDLNHIKNGK